jgi:hypothetical protein
MDEKKALAVIEKHKNEGALVFVNENDLNPQSLFKTLTTKIQAVPTDFHEKPINGEMMPKAHHLQRIAEAAGITFDTKDIVKNETSWTVTVTAIRRGPDGIMYHVDASYDYDWVDRAKDGPKKFALQRAETGAQLRAIRKILGLPVTFNRDNFQRAVVVCRIVANTDELLKNPEMRKTALQIATNGASDIYGPKDVTPQIEALEEPQEETGEEPIDFGEDTASDDGEDWELAAAKQSLEEYQNNEAVKSYVSKGNGRHPIQAIEETLNNPNVTVEEINNLITLLKKIPGVA